MELRVRRLTQTALVPRAAHDTDSGFDVFADASVVIPPGEWRLVSTGVAIELPVGTEGVLRPRSGLAKEFGVSLLNSPGTIDEGYRGEIGVLVINFGKESFCVEAGMRIAQLVIQRRLTLVIKECTELSKTDRNADGFGSTGE